jgi:hypothetical protein
VAPARRYYRIGGEHSARARLKVIEDKFAGQVQRARQDPDYGQLTYISGEICVGLTPEDAKFVSRSPFALRACC